VLDGAVKRIEKTANPKNYIAVKETRTFGSERFRIKYQKLCLKTGSKANVSTFFGLAVFRESTI
jgi:hypothetical protein